MFTNVYNVYNNNKFITTFAYYRLCYIKRHKPPSSRFLCNFEFFLIYVHNQRSQLISI